MNQYWESSEAYLQIQQPGEFNECDDVIEKLRAIVAPLKCNTVLDYGCGCGRLCRVFDANGYTGYDLNKMAIAKAMEANPCYDFTTIEHQLNSDLTFCYTSLLHLDDEEVKEFAAKVNSKYVIIAEVMGRDWRREGNPPVYNREPEEYCALMGVRYALTAKHVFPHEHYAGHYNKRSRDITVLVFKRLKNGNGGKW